MKKVFSIFLLVLMIFMVSVTANAEVDKRFFLDGKLSMETPAGYYYFGEDTPEDSEELKEAGFTKEELLNYLDGASHIYISKELDGEIIVFCEETYSLPFEFYTEPELLEFQKEMKTDYEEMGYEVVETGIEEGFGADFVFAKIGETDEYYPMLIYKTIHNGIYIEFIYIYYGSGEIEYWDIGALASYTEFYGEDEYLKNTYPVEYTVDGIGTKITIPGGWYLDVNNDGGLMATKSKNVAMLYFSYDTWDTFTEEEKSQIHRSELDMDLFTKEDLKELIESEEMKKEYLSFGMNIVGNSVYMMEIGDYSCIVWKVEAAEGFTFKEATAIMYVEDAIGHIFMFTGPFSGKMAEEYKGIVASAKFPEIPDEGGEKADEIKKPAALFAIIGSKTIEYLILGGIFVGIGLAIKKFKGKRKKTELIQNYKESSVTNETEHKTKFCTECGAQIEEEDKFCPLCGAKVKR